MGRRKELTLRCNDSPVKKTQGVRNIIHQHLESLKPFGKEKTDEGTKAEK